jgi:hypothetical protein
MIDRESKSVKRKRCHNATVSAIAPTISVLNSKSALGSHKTYINCLKYGSARDYNRDREKRDFTAR